MGWGAVDDRFSFHSKRMELLQYPAHDSALALWTLSLSWCSGQAGHNFTGYVPSHMARAFGVQQPEEAAQALVDVGLWEARDGGWWFHDWSVWNGPDAKHNRSREQTRIRTQNYRIKLCEEAGDDLTKHSADCPTTDIDGNARECHGREAKRTIHLDAPNYSPTNGPARPDVTSRSVTGSGESQEVSVTDRDVTDSFVEMKSKEDPLTPEFIALMTGRAVPHAV